MTIQGIVSVGVGLVGLGLGTLGIVAGSGALSIVLGLLVIAMASASLWLGWRLCRDDGNRHRRVKAHRQYRPYA